MQPAARGLGPGSCPKGEATRGRPRGQRAEPGGRRRGCAACGLHEVPAVNCVRNSSWPLASSSSCHAPGRGRVSDVYGTKGAGSLSQARVSPVTSPRLSTLQPGTSSRLWPGTDPQLCGGCVFGVLGCSQCSVGAGTGAPESPGHALCTPCLPSWAQLSRRQLRCLGRGRREPGTVLCSSSAFSCPGWESQDDRDLRVSPWLDCIRLPHRSAQSPGLSQASQRRKLICFPRKDAESDGQIELGVPGIQPTSRVAQFL